MTEAPKLTDDLPKSASPGGEPKRRQRAARAAEAAALAMLLACLCARTFIGEVPFRTSALSEAYNLASAGVAADEPHVRPERMELARMTFAALLLAAAALWFVARAASGRLTIRFGYLGVLILAFAGWSLAAALKASDQRSAMDVWIEQVAMLAAFFVSAQLCGDRRRFGLVVVVLAGLGVAMAVKGAWQLHSEIPARINEFEANRVKYLAQQGLQPGTPQAKMFEKRVLERSPTGFGPLANVFASLLIVLLAAAAGLAAQKLASAARTLRNWRAGAKRSEIHLPTLVGVLTAIAAVGVGAILILTRSRGAIAAAAAAALAALAICIWRRRLARHRKAAMAAVAALLIAASAVVIAYGLKHDRLPTKTMTFRWFYWTASAEIARDHPLLGVGPGNFATAYLRYRRLPGGEEQIKMPHNAIAHAATQYGLPGAAVYLAILIGGLLCASRPAADAAISASEPGKSRRALLVVFLAGSAVVSRAVFTEAGTSVPMFLLDALIPAAVLAGCLLMAGWTGGEKSEAFSGPAARIALGCGLAGFALHNMVTFSLWTPGATTAFWIAAGACAGQAGGREWNMSRFRWPVAVAAVAAVAAMVVVIWYPVWRRTVLTERAARAVCQGNLATAADLAEEASKADLPDAISAADIAKILRLQARLSRPAQASNRLFVAMLWAEVAARADPKNPAWHRLSAQIAHDSIELAPGTRVSFRSDENSMLTSMAQALELDPQNAGLRIEYAEMLAAAGRGKDCLAQLAEAERIDKAHYPESAFRLSDAERARMDAIRKTASSGGQ